jgi:hypothetical protein
VLCRSPLTRLRLAVGGESRGEYTERLTPV